MLAQRLAQMIKKSETVNPAPAHRALGSAFRKQVFHWLGARRGCHWGLPGGRMRWQGMTSGCMAAGPFLGNGGCWRTHTNLSASLAAYAASQRRLRSTQTPFHHSGLAPSDLLVLLISPVGSKVIRLWRG